MTTPVPFRFRLRFGSRFPGKVPFPGRDVQVKVSEGLTLAVVARNAESLETATSFHIDGTGFETAESAALAAESLRVRVRLLNALLGLGLNIPVGDEISGQVSEEMKKSLQAERGVGATVIDSVWGASVYPDDGLHFECVVGGNLRVGPSDPGYLLEGLRKLWCLDIALDKPSEEALQILCLATQETSDKAAFLTSYLALEELIQRRPRNDAVREILKRFAKELKELAGDSANSLSPEDANSLVGALSSLSEESFPSALVRLGKQITQPAEMCGMPISKFLSACIDARNKIAHHAEPSTKIPLADLSKSLREFVLGLIWTRNKLPDFTLNTPPSAVKTTPEGLSIRCL